MTQIFEEEEGNVKIIPATILVIKKPGFARIFCAFYNFQIFLKPWALLKGLLGMISWKKSKVLFVKSQGREATS